MSVKIIRATMEHLDFIVNSQVIMAKETEDLDLEKDVVYQGVKAILNRSDLGTYYVAILNGETVSCLFTTFEWSDWRNKGVLWIQSVFVTPKLRGQGIYRKMYSYIQNLVTNDEMLAGIRLYVDKSNHNAYKVYNKLGMSTDHYHLCEWMP